MNRLVCYSLALSEAEPRPDLVRQLEWSVRSLRTYNATVPIVVFTYGSIPREVSRSLEPFRVFIKHQGSYSSRLAQLAPAGWQTLSQYPVLHKFLNLNEIASYRPGQVLCLDCDTLFFCDVDALFSSCRDADCYAREEPTCARSHYGYDQNYVDEEALAAISRQEAIDFVAPFNVGVVLLNNGLVERLASAQQLFVDYAWRFALWMAMNPVEGVAAAYGEGFGISYLRDYFDRLVGRADRGRELAYPSSNRWILEQVALWMTLGKLGSVSYRDFSPADVLQNGEILSRKRTECDWVLCHYFSQNMGRLEEWLRGSQAENETPAEEREAVAT